MASYSSDTHLQDAIVAVERGQSKQQQSLAYPEIQPLLIKVVALAATKATTATKQVTPVSSLMRIQPTAPVRPLIALCLQLCSDL